MQHNIQCTLFNIVIGQAMDTLSYTISRVYISLSRLKVFKTRNTTYSGLIFNTVVIGQDMGTRSNTISCVYINMSRLKIFFKHATQNTVDTFNAVIGQAMDTRNSSTLIFGNLKL